MYWGCASVCCSWVGSFTTLNDEGWCASYVFKRPVSHHDFCSRFYQPGDVSFYSIRGLVLRFPCVGKYVCGIMLEVMTNACAFYYIWGGFYCKSRISVYCRVEVYITVINFLITSYRLIVLVLLLPGCMIPILPLCVSGICPDVWITPTLWGVSQRSRFHVWARRIEWGFSTGCN